MAPTRGQAKTIEDTATATKGQVKTIEDLATQLENSVSKITLRFDGIEQKLAETISSLVNENKELKAANTRLEEEMLGMRNHLNNLEQYQRSSSVRVNNLRIPDNITNNPYEVRNFVYNTVFEPIFQGAVEKGELSAIPSADSVLELAHVLPGPADKPKPIITRFKSRLDRAVVLRLKKQYAPKDPVNRNRQRYPVYEDLTKDNFQLLMKLSKDDRVESAWSIKGQIKYKFKGFDTIHKVENVYVPFEEHFR